MALITTVSLTFLGLTIASSNALVNLFQAESPLTPQSPRFPPVPAPAAGSATESVSESDARRATSSARSSSDSQSSGAAPRSDTGEEEDGEEGDGAQYGLWTVCELRAASHAPARPSSGSPHAYSRMPTQRAQAEDAEDAGLPSYEHALRSPPQLQLGSRGRGMRILLGQEGAPPRYDDVILIRSASSPPAAGATRR
ncbi:hypothetical protein CALCODRAFT_362552 [Calocera cornea HHB12733]|uniref:Uncharacterized protein n=1 Tax=Calocera cornea HHB12733 TaxID=1353952 RepID=A0A165EK66_9BASI|nr:hypothetical protein CALCODRAFT_362552 [Calocera cornea HHB12733]